ncbi:MAG: ABC transporter permease [Phycisphaerales bacterium]
MSFIFAMIRLGLSNLWLHRLRSLLTALGIIFGVAAVILMVAIGEGAKRDALARIERLGAKNIIVRSSRPPESAAAASSSRGRSVRYGITRADLKVLEENFTGAEAIVPLKEVGGTVQRENRRKTSQAFGTTPELQRVANLRVARGRYLNAADLEDRSPVAVLGHELARELFPFDDPLDSTIKIDDKVFKVIGVLAPVGLSGGAGAALVGRDLNFDVHLPLSTAATSFGDQVFRRTSGSFQAATVQISEVYLTAPTRDDVMTYAALARRIMDVRHDKLNDFTMIVPYELLESAKRDALNRQVVLSAIAAISLLVGGIGIMNIMLASVTERTREIGIRRALGATRRHITQQFLVETSVLSFIGGLAGVALGVAGSVGLDRAAPWLARELQSSVEMPTHLTLWSILLAFFVAALTGLVFGIYPAMKAARQDPIVALRHD